MSQTPTYFSSLGRLRDCRGTIWVTGGWLEELTYLAVIAAGADEAVFSQFIGWEKGGYSGENEVDTIARVGDKLTFISCKSVRPDYVSGTKGNGLRKKLMSHLDNADNLIDHFGRDGDTVALVASMDLIDEFRNTPKYEALFGKAVALDVDLVSLDFFEWNTLVNRRRLH